MSDGLSKAAGIVGDSLKKSTLRVRKLLQNEDYREKRNVKKQEARQKVKIKNKEKLELRIKEIEENFDKEDDEEKLARDEMLFREMFESHIVNIWRFADESCDVCRKAAYSHQTIDWPTEKCSIHARGQMFPKKIEPYLPEELLKKKVLHLCHRCKKELTDASSKLGPARAYWNHMAVAELAEDLKGLTRMEYQLLRRVVVHIQIYRRPGYSGQYAFKGQAIFFSQDLQEAEDQIINVLPRPLEDVNIAVVSEEHETRDKPFYRQFAIRVDKVRKAYEYLKRTNHLYSTTQFSEAILQYNSQHIEQVFRSIITDQWKQLMNTPCLILHGQLHLGHKELKNRYQDQSLGLHSFPVALSAIAEMASFPLDKFCTTNVNRVLNQGTDLFVANKKILDISKFIDEIENKKHFHDIVARNYVAYSNFNHQVRHWKVDKKKDLPDKVCQFLAENDYGVICFETKDLVISRAIFKSDGKFYLFCPDQISATGKRASTKGNAAVICAPSDGVLVSRLIALLDPKTVNDSTFSLYSLEVTVFNAEDDENFDEQLQVYHDKKHVDLPRVSSSAEQVYYKTAWTPKADKEILHASMNCTSSELAQIITTKMSGKQSFSIAVVAVAKFLSRGLHPNLWSTQTVDSIMREGSQFFADHLLTFYEALPAMIRKQQKSDLVSTCSFVNSFLNNKEIGALDLKFVYRFQKQVEGTFSPAKEYKMRNVSKSDLQPIEEHLKSGGYLIFSTSNSKREIINCAMVNFDSKFYVFYPHSLGEAGRRTKTEKTGTAAVIRTATLESLCRYCQCFADTKNQPYLMSLFQLDTVPTKAPLAQIQPFAQAEKSSRPYSSSAAADDDETAGESGSSRGSSGTSGDWLRLNRIEILFGLRNQFNIVGAQIPGRQCTVMAATAIIYWYIATRDVKQWTRTSIETILSVGNKLYECNIRQQLLDVPRSPVNIESFKYYDAEARAGERFYTNLTNFVVRDLLIFNQRIHIRTPVDHGYPGLGLRTRAPIREHPNYSNFDQTIRQFFSRDHPNRAGVIIAQGYSRAIFKHQISPTTTRYYVFDSHNVHADRVHPEALRSSLQVIEYNGNAAMIQYPTLDDLINGLACLMNVPHTLTNDTFDLDEIVCEAANPAVDANVAFLDVENEPRYDLLELYERVRCLVQRMDKQKEHRPLKKSKSEDSDGTVTLRSSSSSSSSSSSLVSSSIQSSVSSVSKMQVDESSNLHRSDSETSVTRHTSMDSVMKIASAPPEEEEEEDEKQAKRKKYNIETKVNYDDLFSDYDDDDYPIDYEHVDEDEKARNFIAQFETTKNWRFLLRNTSQIRILHGNIHQANSALFSSTSGTQCVAIMAVSICLAKLKTPSKWTSRDVDSILVEGNRFYKACLAMKQSTSQPLDQSDLLKVQHLIKETGSIFGRKFKLNYHPHRPLIIDTLMEDGDVLKKSLKEVFGKYSCAILAHQKHSRALIRTEKGGYFIFDSNPISSTGEEGTAENDYAAVFEVENPLDLLYVLEQLLGVKASEQQSASENRIYIDYLMCQVAAEQEEVPSSSIAIRKMVPIKVKGNVTTKRLLTMTTFPLDIAKKARYDKNMLEKAGENKDSDEEDAEKELYNVEEVAFMDMDPNFPLVDDYLDVEKLEKRRPKKQYDDKEPVLLQNLKRKKGEIVDPFKESRLEELAFYELFPDGHNGLYEPERQNVITPLDYFKTRISSTDLRFQRIDYLFYALSIFEACKAKQSINVMANVRQGGEQVENLHLVLQNIRGTSSYWNKARNDLFAMIRTLGPPHFFLTFSCNDLHWPDFIFAYLIATRTNLTKDQISDDLILSLSPSEVLKLSKMCPVPLIQQFMVRVNGLMNILKSPLYSTAIFGSKLVDYWWRVEFQLRGSPHIHMLIWLDATTFPEFGTDAYIARLDKIATCKMPDKESDPDLHYLVKHLQVHRHTDTCHKGQKDKKRCRFNFPRPERHQTIVKKAESEKEIFKNNGRLCELKRSSNERMVNNYNPKLLRLVGSNMDIQSVGMGLGIAFYIAKYASKDEPETVSEKVAETINRIQNEPNTDIAKKLFKSCMATFRQREVSGCETAGRMTGSVLKMASRKVLFVNSQKPEMRYKMVSINKGDPNSRQRNVVTMSIIDRYKVRPDCLENMCLAEFAMKYEPIYTKKKCGDDEDPGSADEDAWVKEDEKDEKGMNKDRDDDELPADKAGNDPEYITLKVRDSRMRRRKRVAIIRNAHFNSLTQQEEYFYGQLMLNVPFREEDELLQGNKEAADQTFKTARDAFQAKVETINKNLPVYAEYHAFAREIEEAVKVLSKAIEAEENDEPENEIDDILDKKDQEGDEAELDSWGDELKEEDIVRLMPDDEYQRQCKSMNTQQRLLMNIIKRHIQSEVNAQKSQGVFFSKSSFQPLRLFITGGPGTGKTFTLKLIVEAINREYAQLLGNKLEYAKVGAPTGVAALLVRGLTLHRLLNIPVSKSRGPPKYFALTGMYHEKFVEKWEHVRFMIIDEISMVSYDMLSYIDQRLRQIKQEPDKPFGGLNILAFGDFLQLLPVNGTAVYKKPTRFNSKTAIIPEDLWQGFELFELTENMRQKNDAIFVDLLNAMREGNMQPRHFAILQAKYLHSDQMGDFAPGGPAIRIMPKNSMVEEHNNEVVQIFAKKTKMMQITAFDQLLEQLKPMKGLTLESVTPTDIRQTGGFPKTLTLYVGARIMLRRNIDLTKGLVNGSIGEVVEILCTYGQHPIHEKDIPTLVVRFDKLPGLHQIRPTTVEFDSLKGYGMIVRYMLPVVLCYAATVHKMQGCTVPRAVVHLGSENFAAGQAYVAISRVETLDGLQLDKGSFDETKLNHINTEGSEELNRLRRERLYIERHRMDISDDYEELIKQTKNWNVAN